MKRDWEHMDNDSIHLLHGDLPDKNRNERAMQRMENVEKENTVTILGYD